MSLLRELEAWEGADVDCVLSAWSEWSDCDCNGTALRARAVLEAARGDGAACADALVETASCAAPATCDGSCAVGEWSDWSSCSVACGDGVQYRARNVTAPALLGDNATACPAPLQTRACAGADGATCAALPACVAEFGAAPAVRVVASGFAGARDVDFHPTPGAHLGAVSEGRSFDDACTLDDGSTCEEAWVVNANNHSISIVAAIDSPNATTIARRDRGYFHYIVNATAIAFNHVSDSGRAVERDTYGYFATCQNNLNDYTALKEPNYFMVTQEELSGREWWLLALGGAKHHLYHFIPSVCFPRGHRSTTRTARTTTS